MARKNKGNGRRSDGSGVRMIIEKRVVCDLGNRRHSSETQSGEEQSDCLNNEQQRKT